MRTVIVIPARKGSTRFPNKPMAKICGRSVLERTWKIAHAVPGIDTVVVATDDDTIREHARSFGAQVIMTRPECENGTLRTFDAIQKMEPRPGIVINLQGDAVLTPPWVIEAVVQEMKRDVSVGMATPATRLDWRRYDEFVRSKEGGRVSGTLVVFDQKKNALYFSKGLIPFLRDRSVAEPPVYRHIGLYGYRYATLSRYSELAPTPLESVEKLEQLRALEHGISIRVVPVDYRGRTHGSIDNPEDVATVERIISEEGELVA